MTTHPAPLSFADPAIEHETIRAAIVSTSMEITFWDEDDMRRHLLDAQWREDEVDEHMPAVRLAHLRRALKRLQEASYD